MLERPIRPTQAYEPPQRANMNQSERADQIQIINHLSGLTPSIDPKYLYDPLGCRLFDAITFLDEYYPTKIEQVLIEQHLDDISREAGNAATLIDLGAGNCQKARPLLSRLAPAHYLAVDISEKFLQETLSPLRHEYPKVAIEALAADLGSNWTLPLAETAGHRMFFYPGSSIGNFSANAARNLLGRVFGHCRKGDSLLIGIDLIKDRRVLEAAYNDSIGLTAAFNLNILAHINRLIDSDFDPGRWLHRAFFNAEKQRVEMHVEACETHTVNWPGGHRRFVAGERIHTENSHKYCLPEFTACLQEAGFGKVRSWTDSRQWFAICHAQA